MKCLWLRPLFAVFFLSAASLVWASCPSLASPRSVPPLPNTAWSLATFNAWQFRDAVKGAGYDNALPVDLVAERVDALADFIISRMGAPSLVALQEVENRAVLHQLEEALVARGFSYQGALIEGNDPSGIDVAVLSRAPVKVASVSALFAQTRWRNGVLFSRPPLLLTLSEPEALRVVVVHLRSARQLSSERVQAKRLKQVDTLLAWLRDQRDMPHIVMGDFNSADVPGAFGDSIRRFSQGGLVSAWQWLPEEERYSYVYRCQRQAIDNIWLSPVLTETVNAVFVTRGNAGRYRALYGSKGLSPVSDHDALVLQRPLPAALQ